MWIKLLADRGITLSYHTIGFLCFFLVFFALYFVLFLRPLRRMLILAANILFYGFMGGIGALAVIGATSLIVYVGSVAMGHVYLRYERTASGLKGKEKRAKLAPYRKKCFVILLVVLILVIGILVYVKAGKLIGFSAVEDLRDLRPGRILVPLGISYYTLSCAGYLLDVYWRKAKVDWNYFDLLTCMTYFPCIVEGPICNYARLFEQLKALPRADYVRITFGFQRMVWGFFKKLVVADRLSIYPSVVFGDPASFAGTEIVIAVICNVFSLYADFSGCMDIVIGASEVIGITLEENFRQPFFSTSAAEFWRRWHMTLGLWFRNYVYMPMVMRPSSMKRAAGIRKKMGSHAAQLLQGAGPLMLVWILTGLWHGTGLDYLAWGIYWGTLILLGMAFVPLFQAVCTRLKFRTDTAGWRVFGMVRTFILFGIGRMLTAGGSLEMFVFTVRRLFSELRPWVLFDDSLYTYGLDRQDTYVAVFGLLVIWIVGLLHEKGIRIREMIAAQPILFRWCIYLGAIFFILVFGYYGYSYNASEFAYANF